MCASYFIHGPIGGPTRQAFDELLLPAFAQERVAIRPTDCAPVLCQDAQGTHLQSMRWGLIPHWARDPSIARHTFNARAETIAEKPSFRDAFAQRRCLLPASGWHEWTGARGHKQRHVLDAGAAALTLGGLWERWRANDGDWRLTFTVVTVPATPAIADIHDRMPLLVAPADRAAWLSAGADAAHALLQPWSSGLRVDAVAR